MKIGTHQHTADIGSIGTEVRRMCTACSAQGTTADLLAISCAAVSVEPERPIRQAHGVRTWFTPDGPISEMIYTNDEHQPALTVELIDDIIGQINPADIETHVMAMGASHGYEHMVQHTLSVIRTRLHDQVHDLAAPSE